jgi:hypothetical protein
MAVKPNIKTLRRAKFEADFARSGVVSNQGGAPSTIPRRGSGLFGLFRVVVSVFPPFFPHLVSFWGHETKCFRTKIAIWPKIGQLNSFDSTRWRTSGQEWP